MARPASGLRLRQMVTLPALSAGPTFAMRQTFRPRREFLKSGSARILLLTALALLTRLAARGDQTQTHTPLFGEPLDNAATPQATILASDESNAWTRFDLPDDRNTGLQVMPTYFGDVFTNARGGRSTNGATRYLGLLDIELIADFERLQWRVPGKL